MFSTFVLEEFSESFELLKKKRRRDCGTGLPVHTSPATIHGLVGVDKSLDSLSSSTECGHYLPHRCYKV